MFYKDQAAPPRRLPHVSTIVETPHSEEPPTQMVLEEPGQDTSAYNMSNMNSKDSEMSERTVVDKPMPEASVISKKVTELEEEGKDNVKNKKKKEDVDTAEFHSIVEHQKVIVEELKYSNFSYIEEVLGMYPTLNTEHIVGTIVTMTGSTKLVGSIPGHTKKFYKERKKVFKQNICLIRFH